MQQAVSLKQKHAASLPQCAGAMPLSMVHLGNTVTVVSIRGRDDTRQHLSQLGFVEGATANIICRMGSNLIVEVKGSRIALDGRLASRVMVDA